MDCANEVPPPGKYFNVIVAVAKINNNSDESSVHSDQSQSELIGVSIYRMLLGEKSWRFKLPWKYCATDMAFFRNTTIGPMATDGLQNAVVMGYNTWKSLRNGFLSNRLNVVIRDPKRADDAAVATATIPDLSSQLLFVPSLRAALDECYKLQEAKQLNEIFVIGGAKTYADCFSAEFRGEINEVFKTYIPEQLFNYPKATGSQSSDQSPDPSPDPSPDQPIEIVKHHFFPPMPSACFHKYSSLMLPCEQAKVPFQVEFYHFRDIHIDEEKRYLALLRELLPRLPQSLGNQNRTGVRAFSLFGKTLEFDMSDGRIPLLSTKKVFFRGCVEEMLFFASGSTDACQLQAKNVHIWDGNTSREFLDSRGLSHYEVGDMGPTYGFLFCYAGAEGGYCGKNASELYKRFHLRGESVNQFALLIDGIRRDPYSRRHMINLWSPAHSEKMSLPPCLFNYIFHVDPLDQTVSLMATMRSADLFIGVPFNLCGAALILRMVCHLTGRQPSKLILHMGDVHLYECHISQAQLQLSRTPLGFPMLTFRRTREQMAADAQKDNSNSNANSNSNSNSNANSKTIMSEMELFAANDFVLSDYKHHPGIKAPMCV